MRWSHSNWAIIKVVGVNMANRSSLEEQRFTVERSFNQKMNK